MCRNRLTRLLLATAAGAALIACSSSGGLSGRGGSAKKSKGSGSDSLQNSDQPDSSATPTPAGIGGSDETTHQGIQTSDNTTTPSITESAGPDMVGKSLPPCKPVRKYTYPINSGVSIGCSAAPIVSVQVPDRGYAAARATIPFKHNGGAWHVWAGNVAVGSAVINSYSGSDMCPTALTSDAIHGYGHLADGSNTVTVNVVANAISCVPGTISTQGQGTLEVWVEDDAPACQKHFIVGTNYQSISGSYWDFSLTPQTLLHLALPPDVNGDAKSVLSAIGHIEGTTYSNPNSCDNEQTALGLFGSMDGRAIGSDSAQYKTIPGIVPGAYGHVINTIAVSHPIGPEGHTFDMLPQNGNSLNGRVVTGSNFGDAVLIVIREPATP